MINKWKDLVLKSSLPLEYEVKTYLDSKGCVSHFDYSYMHLDEQNTPKAFSYDIDAGYIRYGHYINIMVECKYRHRTVNWFFLPETYGGPDDFAPLEFMHPINEFINEDNYLICDTLYPETLSPLVSKGVEILSDKVNTKSIRQATNQLAYSFAEHITSAIVHQIDKLLVHDFVFCHVPVIITTANLYRLKDTITIQDVENADEVKDISTEHGILVLKQSPDSYLQNYNLSTLHHFASERRQDLVQNMRWHNDDLDHLLAVLSEQPKAFIIIKMTEDRTHFEKFFHFIDRAIKPPDDLIEAWKAKHDEVKKLSEKLKKMKKSK